VSGADVVGVRQDADGVEADVRTASGAVETRRARYLVGTDGVHSAVRAALNEPFPGRSAVRSVLLADVRLSQKPPDVLAVDTVGDGFGLIAPFGDGWYRVIAWDRSCQQPDDAPVELPEVQAAVRHAFGTDYGMHDARWLSQFHSDERQVPHYRVGRVFLAGDAAHVHSPAGGQGMNTGLQDAANLSWKLAAALRGRGRPDLLDTYQTERHRVGETVLRLSGGLLRVGMVRPWQLPVVRLLARVATGLPAVNQRMAGLVSGIAISYPRAAGEHRLTGQRLPDGAVADARMYDVLGGGQFALLAPGRAGRFDGVRTVAAAAGPDGYVAWAADEPTPAQVEQAVAAWVAAPREPHTDP
jgi:2-polyprenyl-6-methoxyphenol hydroxylase-like FAD-dependent oxidoreductase